MVNWLIELFKSAPNDWELIDVMRGVWNVHGDFDKYKEYSVYEIFYSKHRNEYKLKVSGHHPKTNSMYIEAVRKLNELRNGNKQD
jgi:hypothetical protein